MKEGEVWVSKFGMPLPNMDEENRPKDMPKDLKFRVVLILLEHLGDDMWKCSMFHTSSNNDQQLMSGLEMMSEKEAKLPMQAFSGEYIYNNFFKAFNGHTVKTKVVDGKTGKPV